MDNVASFSIGLTRYLDATGTACSPLPAFAGEAELLVRSTRGTRENALTIFYRTFAITVALQLLATLCLAVAAYFACLFSLGVKIKDFIPAK